VEHCTAVDIEFCSTPGDVECLDFLVRECGMRRVKIGSDDLTNEPLMLAALTAELPLIVSTGMATLDEIKPIFYLSGLVDRRRITLLHCISLYPCPLGLANLRAMDALRIFGCLVGYSDHTIGTDACVLASALGASVIEKHFSFAGYRGVDWEVSASPAAFS